MERAYIPPAKGADIGKKRAHLSTWPKTRSRFMRTASQESIHRFYRFRAQNTTRFAVCGNFHILSQLCAPPGAGLCRISPRVAGNRGRGDFAPQIGAAACAASARGDRGLEHLVRNRARVGQAASGVLDEHHEGVGVGGIWSGRRTSSPPT